MDDVLSRPGVTELTFQVFDRSVHPELIDGLLCRSFERDGYRVTVHLTPAGHVLEWRWRQVVLVEILADQRQQLPEHRQLFGHRVGGERTESYRPLEGLNYQTCFQVERVDEAIFYRLADEIRADGERAGILHRLCPRDRLGLSPLSSVDLQARPGSLIAHVYHTFPEEFAIVKSQTLIDFPQ